MLSRRSSRRRRGRSFARRVAMKSRPPNAPAAAASNGKGAKSASACWRWARRATLSTSSRATSGPTESSARVTALISGLVGKSGWVFEPGQEDDGRGVEYPSLGGRAHSRGSRTRSRSRRSALRSTAGRFRHRSSSAPAVKPAGASARSSATGSPAGRLPGLVDESFGRYRERGRRAGAPIPAPTPSCRSRRL